MLLIIVLLPLLLGTLATLWLGSKSRLLTALAAGLVTLFVFITAPVSANLLSQAAQCGSREAQDLKLVRRADFQTSMG